MTDRHDARVRGVVFGLVLGLTFALPVTTHAQFTEPPGPTAYALTNVIVVRADGVQSPGQTVVVRSGRIEAIGASGSVRVPADARVLDGDTLYIYPGLLDGAGTVKYEFPRDTADRSQIRSWDPPRLTQGFTPSRRVVDVLQATGSDVADLRKKGIVAVAVHPPVTDPLMPGRGALVMLRPGAKTPAELLVRPELAPLMTLRGGRGVYPSTGMGVITWYRQTFLDAQRRTQLAQGPNVDAASTMSAYDPDYSVVEDLLRAQGRVYFAANSADEIRRVLALAAEFRLRPVIVGGAGAWKVATELRASNVPVLVSIDFQRPRQWKPDEQVKEGEEPKELEPGAWREKKQLEEAYANAGRLAEAGVTFALVSGGRGDLREGARKAVEYGLSEADALRALTATPASLYDVASLARVEAGLPATFMVTDRALFDKDTRVLYTFVEGALERGADARSPAGAATDTAGGGAGDVVNAAGMWNIEVEGQESTLRLTQEGTELKGTLESQQGSMPVSGSMDGDAITLTGTLTMGGQSIPLTFTGVVSGDDASGTVDTPMGSIGWRGRRIPGGGVR